MVRYLLEAAIFAIFFPSPMTREKVNERGTREEVVDETN